MPGATGGSSFGSEGMRQDFAIRLREVTLRLPAGRRPQRGASLRPRETIGGPLTAHREVIALDDVSFTVEQGQRVGIIGHNGAGKSVLLRVMAGIYSPTSGSCETRGRISTMLSISPGNYRDATGLEYITLVGLAQGLTRKKIIRNVPDIVQFSEIGDYLHLPLRMYSTGMRTRLAFALATCIDSDVLLIDEDIGAGDLRFRAKAAARIKRPMTAVHTLVIASQDVRVIREFCDVAVWLHQGRVRGLGKVDELLDAYRAEQLDG